MFSGRDFAQNQPVNFIDRFLFDATHEVVHYHEEQGCVGSRQEADQNLLRIS